MTLSYLGRRWLVPPAQPGDPLARLLAARGLSELDGSPPADPLGLPDAPQAAARLRSALARGERILVYGDYDTDGVTSTALAYEALRAAGAHVQTYLPSRQGEGYGLHTPALARAAADGCTLILAVDTGTTAFQEAAWAASSGLDLIVADHHLPGPELPSALAVVNPQRADGTYAFRHLAGVGVTWQLLRAAGLADEALLDLVAIGTVVDVAPLVGENRWLVRRGLERLRLQPRPGIARLCALCGIQPPALTAWHLSRLLGPRLNAAGRVGNPEPALRALLGDLAAAEELEAANRRRQDLEAAVMAAVDASLAAADPGAGVVLAADGWHPGVLGPAAGRLAARLQRPVCLAARDGDRYLGSARGPEGFDLTAALATCADHLVRFGGHRQAAGFEIDGRLLEPAVEALRASLAEAAPAVEPPCTRVDAVLSPAEATLELAAALESLEPCGAGNPPAAFVLPAAAVRGARTVGRDGRHLKGQAAGFELIGFGLGDAAEGLAAAQERPFDLLVRPQRNEWQGRVRLQLQLEDFRPADPDAAWEPFLAAYPDRDQLAGHYRRLRAGQAVPPPALAIFQEAGLLPVPPAGRVDLRASRRYRVGDDLRRRLAAAGPAS